MGLFSRILVAVDGSGPSNVAVQFALRLAAPVRHEAVRFVSVFERDALIGRCTTDVASGLAIDAVLEAAQAECQAALDTSKEAARAVGVEATCIMRTGLAVDAILDEAREWNASCIAMGTRGWKGIARAFFGSCAEGVLRRSRVPVLIGHATSGNVEGSFERMLCAVDDSPAARRAFDAAVAFAVERDAELHVLSVVQVADVYAAAFELEGFDPDGSMSAIYAEAKAAVKALGADAITHGARVKPHVLGGSDIAERIVQCATSSRCGVIMLGTHGRGGIRRAILGSTAEGVLRSTTIPVIAFRDPRPHEDAEDARRADALIAP
jgi:nucleotide-binding universal stress UspA family protein